MFKRNKRGRKPSNKIKIRGTIRKIKEVLFNGKKQYHVKLKEDTERKLIFISKAVTELEKKNLQKGDIISIKNIWIPKIESMDEFKSDYLIIGKDCEITKQKVW